MRGNNYDKARNNPISEIWIDFEKPITVVDGYKEINGYIHFGGKATPKEVGWALEDFGKFLQNLPEDTTYADYDEGDMCCG